MTSTSTDAVPYVLRAQTSGHDHAVETLLDLAFGPGRLAKASYRLREGVDPLDDLSFVAEYTTPGHDHLAGSIRYWPISIGPNADGVMTPALLLGPLAVSPDLQGKGAGMALMRISLDAATAAGHRLVVLVGDLPYYQRAGFSTVPIGSISMPQPFDPSRLLWRELVPGASNGVAGEMVRPTGAEAVA